MWTCATKASPAQVPDASEVAAGDPRPSLHDKRTHLPFSGLQHLLPQGPWRPSGHCQRSVPPAASEGSSQGAGPSRGHPSASLPSPSPAAEGGAGNVGMEKGPRACRPSRRAEGRKGMDIQGALAIGWAPHSAARLPSLNPGRRACAEKPRTWPKPQPRLKGPGRSGLRSQPHCLK